MNPEIKQRLDQIRRGEVPEGYKKTKAGIVPNEWNVELLGEYLQEYRQLTNEIDKYQVYSSSRQGLIPQSQYYDKRTAVETNLGYKIVPNSFVTYRHMSDDDVFHFNINKTGSSVLVSSEYPVFRASEKGDLDFIIPILNGTARFRYFCRMQKMGGTRTRLYYKNLCGYIAAMPPLPEQQKIAEILTMQDKLIELQVRKIEQLQTLKKACLQRMFPKKGCDRPEIRFPEFTDAWEQRKLGEVVNVCSGRDYKHLEEGEIPVYGTGGYMLSVSEALSEKEDAIGIGRKGTIDNPYILKAPFWTVDTLFYCVPKKNYDLNFVYGIYQSINWKAMDESTGVPSLSKTAINNVDISAPSLAEQVKIGGYFSQLDNLITLHQRKLDEEKQKKKALMHLLLTGIVRVKI